MKRIIALTLALTAIVANAAFFTPEPADANRHAPAPPAAVCEIHVGFNPGQPELLQIRFSATNASCWTGMREAMRIAYNSVLWL